VEFGRGIKVEETLFRRGLCFKRSELIDERAVDCFHLISFAPTPSTRTGALSAGKGGGGGGGGLHDEAVGKKSLTLCDRFCEWIKWNEIWLSGWRDHTIESCYVRDGNA
jgi:hypothetical protein